MKHKSFLLFFLLGAILFLGAFTSCSKPDVPPIVSGNPDVIILPSTSRPRPVAQASAAPTPPSADCQ